MKFSIIIPVVGVIYLLFVALPAESFWYSPGEVSFSDETQGASPTVSFVRHIRVDTRISYSVVVRDAEGITACEGSGGPFTYEAVNGPLIGKDLTWWAAGDERCTNLPAGTYWAETCWRIEAPARAYLFRPLKRAFGWILPPKILCRVSPTFEIFPAT